MFHEDGEPLGPSIWMGQSDDYLNIFLVFNQI